MTTIPSWPYIAASSPYKRILQVEDMIYAATFGQHPQLLVYLEPHDFANLMMHKDISRLYQYYGNNPHSVVDVPEKDIGKRWLKISNTLFVERDNT